MHSGYTHHSNHFRCEVDRWPEVRVDNKEQKPKCNAAPDRQMRKLLKNATHDICSLSHYD